MTSLRCESQAFSFYVLFKCVCVFGCVILSSGGAKTHPPHLVLYSSCRLLNNFTAYHNMALIPEIDKEARQNTGMDHDMT